MFVEQPLASPKSAKKNLKKKLINSLRDTALSKMSFKHTQKVENIHGSLTEQKSAIEVFTEVDKIRKIMIENLPPWGAYARTQDSLICNNI